MSDETALTPVQAATMEQVIIGGDLAQLSPDERLELLQACLRVGRAEPLHQAIPVHPTQRQADALRRQGRHGAASGIEGYQHR